MSNIRVNCPECHAAVVLERELLEKTNGHAVCPECTHAFKLVRKAKAGGNPPPAEAAEKQPEPATAAAAGTGGETRRASLMDAIRKPLRYRVPKAPEKEKAPQFAEVAEDPFTFNLLDRDSVSRQMPVTLQPSGSSSITHAPMQQDGQQNHITIHTDSLVFTLMGDNQNNPAAAHPVAMNSTAALPTVHSGGTISPAAAAAAARSETNWTIATIVAMVILVIQLFNFILMLM